MSDNTESTKETIYRFIKRNEPVSKQTVVVRFSDKPILNLRRLLREEEIMYSDANELVTTGN